MISILMYHQIAALSQHRDPHRLAVAPKIFAAQMHFLAAHGYQHLSLQQAVDYWIQGVRAPHKAFVLTFDDGYRDILTHVAPVLCELGWSATVFLVPGWMQGARRQPANKPTVPLLTWADVRRLRDQGFSFGAHSQTHPRLTTLSDADAAWEMTVSRDVIEQELGEPVPFMAYPYGAVDERISHIAANSGYRAACGANRGVWGRFNLWRATAINAHRPRVFATQARGWHHYRYRLRRSPIVAGPVRMAKRILRPTCEVFTKEQVSQ